MAKKDKEMSFLDHLELLRWHIIRSLASILIFSIFAFISKDFVFGTIILGPSRTDFYTYQQFCKLGAFLAQYVDINAEALCIDKLDFTLQSRKMTGQFTMHLMSSFVIGLIVAFPYTFWEIWRFVSPAMYDKERKHSKGAVFAVSTLFISGVLFGYYIVSPLSINFLAGYSLDSSIVNEFDITSYVDTLTMLVLTNGLMFQLPVVAYFLAKSGIITPSFLQTKRRHSIVIILIISAVLTPPDVVSQVLIAIPLIGLYEVSIAITKRVYKKRMKEIGFSEEEIPE